MATIMATRRFDALMIDFYGTLSAGDHLAVDRACQQLIDTYGLNISSHAFAVQWGERFFRMIDESNHDSFRTLYECELQSLEKTMDGRVEGFDPDPFVTVLEQYWGDPPLHPESAEVLRSIHIPTCCVSNADTRPLLQAIEKHGLRFDAIISSEDARCYKPARGIFDYALRTLGMSADRVMHVGDSLHSDIGGAAGAGITTTWVCREDRIHDIGTCKPNYTIKSLTELTDILQQ